jgi:hypothetical protein
MAQYRDIAVQKASRRKPPLLVVGRPQVQDFPGQSEQIVVVQQHYQQNVTLKFAFDNKEERVGSPAAEMLTIELIHLVLVCVHE